MKPLIKIFLLLLFPVISKAQQNPYWQEPTRDQADSFRTAISHENNDTTRMYLYRELGLYYQEVQRDSSLYFFQQHLLIAQKLKLKLWEAEALNRIGLAFLNLGNYPASLEALSHAQTIAEDQETEKNIWQIAAFSKSENPRIARLTVLASIHNHLGILYMRTGDIKKKLFNYFECRRISENIHDTASLSLNSMDLGDAYTSLGKQDSALTYAQEALMFSNESGYKKYKGYILYIAGNIYFKKENYDSAKKYFDESIQINKEQQNLYFLGNAYIFKANLLLTTGMTDSSLYYAKKGLETYHNIGSPEGTLNAYTSLSSIYKAKNNLDSAFIYQGLAMAAKDSLNNAEKIKLFQDIGFDQQLRVQELEKEKIETQNRNRTYALLSGIIVFMLIAFLLFRNNRNRQKANTLLQKQKEELQLALSELKSTQSQLIQSEKMASLGELTAGIAHEIQNPLNFVNNFSEVNKELLVEMKDEMDKGNMNDARAIANDIIDNEEKINHHGKRADAIVKGMLQHSRSSTGAKEPTDINALADEYLRLAYHGLRAKDKSFNATIKTDFDETIGNINIIPQDIGRVILNLITNAFYVVNEKKNQGLKGYEPTVTVKTLKTPPSGGRGAEVLISVKDNGNGIPKKVLDKIFQPFFTTKPTGQGTGLGLSLSYDIVKAHGGEIKVKTKENEGSEFIIELPVK